MAVYERRYQPWRGTPTPVWSRFLVIPRFAFKSLFQKRLFSAFYLVASGVFPLLCLLAVYARYNAQVLQFLAVPPELLPPIGERFYFAFISVQGVCSFFVTLFAGPSLIATDLAHNALPLYLSRPLSRFEYVLGKQAVLVILLSLMTWVPGALIFLTQVSLEAPGFLAAQGWLLGALFAGAWIWILFLSLLALAISAYVKKRLLAQGAMLGVFVILAGFGDAFNGMFPNMTAGRYLNIPVVIQSVWAGLFAMDPVVQPMLAAGALAGMMAVSGFLLHRKLRPLEVVS